MSFTRLKTAAVLFAAGLLVVGAGVPGYLVVAGEPPPSAAGKEPPHQPPPAGTEITPQEFERLHKEIRPHAGEATWSEISWTYDLHRARQKAAAEGKPLCVWRMAGDPTGVC